MTTPFSAAQARLNGSVMARLSTASATLDGASFNVIFDAAYADPLGIAGAEPRATCSSADVSTATLGTAISINGSAYTVRDKQPDGTGLTVLLLEAA